MQMIAERADIEKTYSKSLKVWARKWSEYLQKGCEYGTMKNTWMSSLNEADKIAEIHLTTNNALNDELNGEIKAWQKTNYVKSIVNQLKTAKEYEEEFKKVSRFWFYIKIWFLSLFYSRFKNFYTTMQILNCYSQAQKPWAKKYALVEKTKKEYHAACKSYQSAKIQFANSQNDTAISPDQVSYILE
jgi:protein kinase C and casein kinase substrate in neurons protein